MSDFGATLSEIGKNAPISRFGHREGTHIRLGCNRLIWRKRSFTLRGAKREFSSADDGRFKDIPEISRIYCGYAAETVLGGHVLFLGILRHSGALEGISGISGS